MEPAPIVASTWVGRPPEEIYALLADLREHWRLAGRWVQALELGDDGGVVRLRGPLGVTRTARTRVVLAEAPGLLAGEAVLGATRANVSWLLRTEGEGTRVTLRADVVEATSGDRLLLALGGRKWLRARFRVTLARLAAHAAKSPHEPDRLPVG